MLYKSENNLMETQTRIGKFLWKFFCCLEEDPGLVGINLIWNEIDNYFKN